MNENTVSAPWLKLATAWGAFGITSWTEAAGFFASVYSAILIGEWLWKKIRHHGK